MSIRPEVRAAAPSFVRLLLGDPNSSTKAANELAKPELWRQALALSAMWGLVPQFTKRLRPLWVRLDPDFRDRLQSANVAATAQSMLAIHSCSTVLERFERAGITAVAFKGIGLIGTLYGPGDRMMTDIDLLIRPRDVRLASDILRVMNFSSKMDSLQGYAYPVHEECHWIDKYGVELDLHWRIGATPPPEMTAEKILSRSDIVKTCNVKLRVPSPLDSIMLTIHHTYADFAPDGVVRGLCDLASWWNIHPRRWNISDAITHVQLCHLTTSCLALWRILIDLNSESPAREGALKLSELASKQQREDASRLKELFDIQLQEKTAGSDLLYFLVRPLPINLRIVQRIILHRIQSRGTNKFATAVHAGERQISDLANVYQLLYDLVRIYPRRRALYHALVRVNRRYEST